MESFDCTINVRFTESQIERIKDKVENLPDLYNSPSHFIHCATLRLLREEV